MPSPHAEPFVTKHQSPFCRHTDRPYNGTWHQKPSRAPRGWRERAARPGLNHVLLHKHNARVHRRQRSSLPEPSPQPGPGTPGSAAPERAAPGQDAALVSRPLAPVPQSLGQRLTVKSVHLRYLPAFVIASQQRDSVRPLGFQRQKVSEGLQAVIPSVHKVTLQVPATFVNAAAAKRRNAK